MMFFTGFALQRLFSRTAKYEARTVGFARSNRRKTRFRTLLNFQKRIARILALFVSICLLVQRIDAVEAVGDEPPSGMVWTKVNRVLSMTQFPKGESWYPNYYLQYDQGKLGENGVYYINPVQTNWYLVIFLNGDRVPPAGALFVWTNNAAGNSDSPYQYAMQSTLNTSLATTDYFGGYVINGVRIIAIKPTPITFSRLTSITDVENPTRRTLTSRSYRLPVQAPSTHFLSLMAVSSLMG